MKSAYIGSFDPVTKGHVDVIVRAMNMYDHLYVAIGVNPDKKTLFSVEQRLDFIYKSLRDSHQEINWKKLTITSFEGLAVDFMRINNIGVTVRGIRNSTDVEYENNMNLINRDLSGGTIETVYVPCNPKYEMVSSSVVKMMVKSLIDVSDYVSLQVKAALEMKLLGVFFIGVVGRSGSGKSTYCESLRLHTIDFDKLVRDIWDSDEEDCVKMREQLLIKLKEKQHNLVRLTDDGSGVLVKEKLREFITYEHNNEWLRGVMKPFIDIQYRKKLRTVVDSSVWSSKNVPDEFLKFTEGYTDQGHIKIVCLDAPMLIEYAGLSRVNNMVINIHVPDEVSISRIVKRDGLTVEQARKRLKRQMHSVDVMAKVRNCSVRDGYGHHYQIDNWDTTKDLSYYREQYE